MSISPGCGESGWPDVGFGLPKSVVILNKKKNQQFLVGLVSNAKMEQNNFNSISFSIF